MEDFIFCTAFPRERKTPTPVLQRQSSMSPSARVTAVSKAAISAAPTSIMDIREIYPSDCDA
jgi:hypothetical protein